MIDTPVKPPPPTLVSRYQPSDLDILGPDARVRYVEDGASWNDIAPLVAWELLYRKEPELYERLIRGERIHPKVIEALPRGGRCVELAAGTGRLTVELAGRCERVVAIEPAAGLRTILGERTSACGNVEVRHGFFDATGLPDGWADLAVSCSAFTADDAHGGEAGLRELERIVASGGTIAFVWPSDVDWLLERGFSYESYPGDMDVEFETLDEAIELARIFYPDAVEEIAARGKRRVPFEVLGMNAPRDIVHKVVA